MHNVPPQGENVFFLRSVCKLGILCELTKYPQRIVMVTLKSKEARGCHKSELLGVVETSSGLV